MEQFRAHGLTHPGTARDRNEDAFVSRPDIGLWAVADGAGGHDAGDVASAMVATSLGAIPGTLSAEETLAAVRQAVAETDAALREHAAQKDEGSVVASTVVVLIVRQQHFACLWAGDSRAYLLRDGVLQRVTRDHSLVQELIDVGAIDESGAEHHPRANVITRAVGGGPPDAFELEKTTGQLAVGDRFLLCTDGLSKVLDDAALEEVLRNESPEEATARLLKEALAREARDNVTVVVMEVVGDGPL
ncbi:MAG: serine/threonine-protein phosphatase [Acetobacteraceae bacterium]|nr:serine/threonine-protein phosphatase [Acetobacteraceae bacterium]MBV8574748.1 serine/threonine-protein phosphatase [Acetobacteraceae bacterium]